MFFVLDTLFILRKCVKLTTPAEFRQCSILEDKTHKVVIQGYL